MLNVVSQAIAEGIADCCMHALLTCSLHINYHCQLQQSSCSLETWQRESAQVAALFMLTCLSHSIAVSMQLREIAVGSGGGVASVHVDGFDQLMPIFIGVAEAAALVYATTGGEGRRPSTLGTWKRSLEVCICQSLRPSSTLES